jgi:hypothetical protein
MMMPGITQQQYPMMVNMIMNHGMGGLPSNVAERGDCVVARHFSVEKNCTAFVMTSSLERLVCLLRTESAIVFPDCCAATKARLIDGDNT